MTSPPIRVETVRVRNTGRRPMIAAALAVTLVAVSIVKPWAGGDPAQPGPAPASPMPAVAIAPVPTASAPGPAESAQTVDTFAAATPGPLAPGQIGCGSSDWRIVTLGDFAG